ncbi:helix-turn-helix domain-containing protein [Actinacidiphila oryziradicis]|uniref:Helix-turn-helix transcriptional regulator n=1 Tax=Actinacidiphila oryziradicis TaxID=2571141 RepID=A0A4U0SUH3_9ACTN|nr:helix-turn-helix transcriptional regulator [Actinacidiphila oryziradicis]TKA13208.1 helix-turn-helix transcriptional regulator [Actinacidiphila oryziradicis]
MANTSVGQRACMFGTGQTLRTLRRARGWTLSQAAAKAGMDESHLSKVERGLAGLSVDTLSRLAGVYDLTELQAQLAPYARDAA